RITLERREQRAGCNGDGDDRVKEQLVGEELLAQPGMRVDQPLQRRAGDERVRGTIDYVTQTGSVDRGHPAECRAGSPIGRPPTRPRRQKSLEPSRGVFQSRSKSRIGSASKRSSSLNSSQHTRVRRATIVATAIGTTQLKMVSAPGVSSHSATKCEHAIATN